MVQNPRDFGGGKIRVQQQAGFRAHDITGAGALQFLAAARGAAVLPHDGWVNRRAARALPHQRGLALVGDADGDDALGPGGRIAATHLRQRLAAGG